MAIKIFPGEYVLENKKMLKRVITKFKNIYSKLDYDAYIYIDINTAINAAIIPVVQVPALRFINPPIMLYPAANVDLMKTVIIPIANPIIKTIDI